MKIYNKLYIIIMPQRWRATNTLFIILNNLLCFAILWFYKKKLNTQYTMSLKLKVDR